MAQTHGPVTEAMFRERTGRGRVDPAEDPPHPAALPAPVTDGTLEERLEAALDRASANLEDANYLQLEILKAVASNATFTDIGSIAQDDDFQFPRDVDFDPLTDEFNPDWLVGDARRRFKIIAAFGRVQFIDVGHNNDNTRTFTVRLHFA